MTDEERIEKPSIFRFCKTHGYIYCKCPDDSGLSLKEFQALEAKLKAAERVIEAIKKFKLKFEAFQRYQQQHLFQGMEAAEQSWAEVSEAGMLDFTDLFEALKAYDEATK